MAQIDFDKRKAKQIIAEGDVNSLVSEAESIGKQLARELNTNQIRNIFGEVRKIEMAWPPYREDMDEAAKKRSQEAYNRTVLLRPKLAYQSQRERGQGVQYLRDVLDPCIEVIQGARTEADKKGYFDRFVDFFEAILAYHKAGGGK